jgi:hypothetical protein
MRRDLHWLLLAAWLQAVQEFSSALHGGGGAEDGPLVILQDGEPVGGKTGHHLE